MTNEEPLAHAEAAEKALSEMTESRQFLHALQKDLTEKLTSAQAELAAMKEEDDRVGIWCKAVYKDRAEHWEATTRERQQALAALNPLASYAFRCLNALQSRYACAKDCELCNSLVAEGEKLFPRMPDDIGHKITEVSAEKITAALKGE